MAEANRTCPSCREAIPDDAPGGACPRCLIGVGLSSGSGATGGTGGGAAPDVDPAEVRRRFPAYDVAATLGRGGMGVVFRARQKALDRDVALKVLPASAARPAGFAERFEREAKALARLQHPGIVQVFDFGTSQDGWCYLAMEFVDGTNLRRALAGGRLAPKEALAIVPQICDALQYAHDQGVVHRDIKPENVLLTRDGRVKIADFGLAKLAAAAAAGGDESGGGALTRTGQTMGTPLYMAPEQIEHPGDVDHRADIYSLGVVFYEMLTGELPLGRFASPSRKCDVDARIDEIVLRTLEKERDARYQRAADVRTEMDAAASAEVSRVVVGRHEFRPAHPGRAALGLLLLLGGLVTYFAAAVHTHHDWWWALGVAAGGAIVLALSDFRRVARPPQAAGRRAAAEREPPAPLSRLAIASLFAPCAVAGLVWLVWSMNRGTAPAVLLALLRTWSWAAAFAGVALAIVAAARVRASGGRLRGTALAVIGGGISLVAAAASYQEVNSRVMYESFTRDTMQRAITGPTPGTAGSGFDAVPSGSSSQPNVPGAGDSAPNGWPRPLAPKPKPSVQGPRLVDGVEVAPGVPDTMVAETVHGPAIRGLFGLAQALWPAKSPDEIAKLYSPDDAKLVAALDVATRADRGGDGALGLPLATQGFLGGSLRLARVTKVTVEWSRTRGWVTFTCNGTAYVADVARDPGDLATNPWHFSLTPVRRATEQPAAAEEQSAPPPPVGGTRK
jgi:predicted Ser/Thr protein kinase